MNALPGMVRSGRHAAAEGLAPRSRSRPCSPSCVRASPPCSWPRTYLHAPVLAPLAAALVSLSLFGAYITRAGITVADSSILDPEVFAG